ncbi:flagellar M-ring protein FliF [Microbacterium sp. zg.Y1090]|uniref:flagellar basal-body MS-ring/collar protein FliF n=1 Tax=Microbacterium wangruii TaxID=3049073 RepID=UPI00214D9D4C|nr:MULTISPECIES: flagellar basal-body MS-ring/collar protein FliF [unclassified Microbacterium]MCR2819252.1 flagellar M-ring protein FliF [Microbacterium sp. zg.Y1090]WIM28234.1 flagellar basal-body MS-ring/collar protein FliF [Microbacterium sp. zg-Y1090]
MPAAVSSAFAGLRSTVASFTVAQRTIAIIGIAVLVMGAVAIAGWLSRPTLTPLFTGLTAADASAVVEQLRSASVGYELTDGGTTVLVPESAVYEQRLAAAAAGLPSAGSDGYTLLDSMGVTSSEFQQTVTYKRAIEGELARTITALKGVKTASVQLAIPEESVFVSQTVAPTASVFVDTPDGASLSSSQVEAIVHLTSAAVSGMAPENVTVVDQAGRTLSAVGVGTAGGIEQQASAYELRIADSIQTMLDTVVGAGNATVTVAAEMQQASSERIEETYTPIDGDAATSEQTSTETYSGPAAGTGVLGAETGGPAMGGDGTYESSQATRNSVINKAVESTTTPAGSLTRQSVAVAVDRTAAEAINLDQLTALVSSAAGIDRARGDDMTVELVTFSSTDAAAAQAALDAARAEEEAARRAELLQTAMIVAAALVVLILATGTGIVVRRRRSAAAAAVLTPLALPADGAGGLDSFGALVNGAPTAVLEQMPTIPLSLPELEPEPDPEPAQVTLDRRRAELGEFARRDPARTADLLRSLLREEQDA